MSRLPAGAGAHGGQRTLCLSTTAGTRTALAAPCRDHPSFFSREKKWHRNATHLGQGEAQATGTELWSLVFALPGPGLVGKTGLQGGRKEESGDDL